MVRPLVRYPGRDRMSLRHVAVEDRLADLDQHEVDDDHPDEESEESRRQRLEPQHVRERRVRKVGAGCDAEQRGEVSGLLARLRKNGTRRVRMAKITRLCVASDSTNHPERNSGAWASNTPSMIPNVAKSKSELIGPKKSMKRRIIRMSQCAGFSSCSGSTLSVGIVISLVS